MVQVTEVVISRLTSVLRLPCTGPPPRQSICKSCRVSTMRKVNGGTGKHYKGGS